jgi:hypothetical protein
LGVLPRSGEYEKLLPLDAILLVSPDGSDLAAKLDADRGNPDAAAAVERARILVREQHSWKNRAAQIFRRLDVGERPAFENVAIMRTRNLLARSGGDAETTTQVVR